MNSLKQRDSVILLSYSTQKVEKNIWAFDILLQVFKQQKLIFLCQNKLQIKVLYSDVEKINLVYCETKRLSFIATKCQMKATFEIKSNQITLL